MKSWPKVKLGQVQVDSNIAQNHPIGPYLAVLTYIYHYLPIFGCI